MLELPLERTAADEGAAFGAALLGGVAGGLWARRRGGGGGRAADLDGRAGRGLGPAYAEGREKYRALYPAIRDVVRRGTIG